MENNTVFTCRACVDFDLCSLSLIKTDAICEFFVPIYPRTNKTMVIDDLFKELNFPSHNTPNSK